MRRGSGGISTPVLQSQLSRRDSSSIIETVAMREQQPGSNETSLGNPNEVERSRFGYSGRRPSPSPRESRCNNRVSDAVQKAMTGPVDLVALLDRSFEEPEQLRNLMRMKLIAGKYDYKGRISELADFSEDVKSALMKQLDSVQSLKSSAVVIQENINTRLSLATEELVAQRALTQQLSSDLAVAKQQVDSQDDLCKALETARKERATAIAECEQRLDSCQALCKREVAEAADACQRQLEGVSSLHERNRQLEAEIAAFRNEREASHQEHASLLREHAMLSGEASALRAAKEEFQAKVAANEQALDQRNCKIELLQKQFMEAESQLKHKDQQLAERDDRLNQVFKESDVIRLEVKQCQSALSEREADVKDLHEKLMKVEDLHSQKSSHIEELQSHLAKVDGVCAQRGDDIMALQARLHEKETALTQKDSRMVQSDMDVRSLKIQCEEKDVHLLELQTQLHEKDDSFREQTSDLQLLTAQLAEKENALKQRQSNLQRLEEKMREQEDVIKKKDDDLRESLRSMQQIHADSSGLVQTQHQKTQQLELQLQTLMTTEREMRERSQTAERSLEQMQFELGAKEQAQQALEAERDQLAETAAKTQASLRTREEELAFAASGLTAARTELTQAQRALGEKSKELDASLQAQGNLQLAFTSYKEHHGISNQDQMGAITELKFTVDKLSRTVDVKQTEVFQQQGNASKHREYASILEQRLSAAEKDRRELHNAVQELKGNIRVFCRVKPVAHGVDQSMDIQDNGKIILTHGGESYNFGYDKVFDSSSSQVEIFDEVSGLVQSALDGYKVCIFAYGQTGSGKTFTMQGTSGQESWGLIPRSLSKIFEHSRQMCSQGWSWSLQASFFEVYNETFRDLLQTGALPPGVAPPVHVIKHDDVWGTIVTNMTTIEVDSMEQVRALTAKAAKQRSVGSTDCNAVSSRSHAVFALYLKGTNSKLNAEHHGALHLVDLAGSERLNKSGSTGDRLKETQNINRSLSSLADVFCAKTERRSHVPFRNSKLTHLMEPCLSGQGKTLMLVNVCPDEYNAHETLCSLRFASQVNQCNTGGKAKRAVKPLAQSDSLSTSARGQHGVQRMQSARRLTGNGADWRLGN